MVDEASATSRWARILSRPGRFVTTLVVAAALITIAEVFETQPFDESPAGLVLLLSLCLSAWLALELVLHTRPKVVVREVDIPFPDRLVRHVRDLYDSRDYAAVLRHREALSRLLWLEGDLDQRLRLGDVAEDAAIQLTDRTSQAAALIDDLGWTSVALKNYERAEGYLRHGLRIADEEGIVYWKAKAYRHLAGLYVELKQFDVAYDSLEQAMATANEIEEDLPRREMIAGIEYGYALTAYSRNDLDNSLAHLKRSDELRQDIGDASRTVRIYAMMGKIFEAQGDRSAAKDSFRRGLNESRAVRRRDEEIRNLLGLARIYRSEHRQEEAESYEHEAHQLMASTPIPYEWSHNELMARPTGRTN